MDEVFDSGRPAWKGVPKGSRLDQLQRDIETGELKVGRHADATTTTTETVEQHPKALG